MYKKELGYEEEVRNAKSALGREPQRSEPSSASRPPVLRRGGTVRIKAGRSDDAGLGNLLRPDSDALTSGVLDPAVVASLLE